MGGLKEAIMVALDVLTRTTVATGVHVQALQGGQVTRLKDPYTG